MDQYEVESVLSGSMISSLVVLVSHFPHLRHFIFFSVFFISTGAGITDRSHSGEKRYMLRLKEKTDRAWVHHVTIPLNFIGR